MAPQGPYPLELRLHAQTALIQTLTEHHVQSLCSLLYMPTVMRPVPTANWLAAQAMLITHLPVKLRRVSRRDRTSRHDGQTVLCTGHAGLNGHVVSALMRLLCEEIGWFNKAIEGHPDMDIMKEIVYNQQEYKMGDPQNGELHTGNHCSACILAAIGSNQCAVYVLFTAMYAAFHAGARQEISVLEPFLYEWGKMQNTWLKNGELPHGIEEKRKENIFPLDRRAGDLYDRLSQAWDEVMTDLRFARVGDSFSLSTSGRKPSTRPPSLETQSSEELFERTEERKARLVALSGRFDSKKEESSNRVTPFSCKQRSDSEPEVPLQGKPKLVDITGRIDSKEEVCLWPKFSASTLSSDEPFLEEENPLAPELPRYVTPGSQRGVKPSWNLNDYRKVIQESIPQVFESNSDPAREVLLTPKLEARAGPCNPRGIMLDAPRPDVDLTRSLKVKQSIEEGLRRVTSSVREDARELYEDLIIYDQPFIARKGYKEPLLPADPRELDPDLPHYQWQTKKAAPRLFITNHTSSEIAAFTPLSSIFAQSRQETQQAYKYSSGCFQYGMDVIDHNPPTFKHGEDSLLPRGPRLLGMEQEQLSKPPSGKLGEPGGGELVALPPKRTRAKSVPSIRAVRPHRIVQDRDEVIEEGVMYLTALKRRVSCAARMSCLKPHRVVRDRDQVLEEGIVYLAVLTRRVSNAARKKVRKRVRKGVRKGVRTSPNGRRWEAEMQRERERRARLVRWSID